MRYFAYGSNIDICQTRKRVGNFKFIGIATLNGYDIKFNKKSTIDGSGKANIVKAGKTSKVEGVVFEFTGAQFDLMDNAEKGYHRSEPLNVLIGGEITRVLTYIADFEITGLLPSIGYLKIIKDAAEMIGLSDSYQKKLKSFQAREEQNNL
ncbi:gamma-glutamylcyclotransferase [Candidatus Microgenomates bacterium]|nr:gamma-glutamylcyclotransferase [Candidatus Microgenomates bacterium]